MTDANPLAADPTLVSALKWAMAQWAFLIFTSMLVLDFGRFHKITLIAALAYTLGVGLFAARRGTRRPTTLQRAAIIFSPAPLVVLAYQLASLLAPSR